jgi:SPFH domain/Band 7 family protein
MESMKRKFGLLALAAFVVALPFVYYFWTWVVERVEVGPSEIIVVTNLWGNNLPEGEIIAPDHSYKGILLEPRREGRHFINPLFQTFERAKLVQVPAGQCLVQTRKYGTPIPADRINAGDFLARDGERGVVKEVLLPGNHAINPYAYSYTILPAIEIHADQVGVRTLKAGKDPRTLAADVRKGPYVVPEGYRGVQEKPVSQGTYYVNPYVENIVPVSVAINSVEFKDIEFPTKDGFLLKPHVQVAYKVESMHAPELFVTLTDEGSLHQTGSTPQEIEKNEVLQKVVLPLIRGYVRTEGSKFEARDFFALPSESDPAAPKVKNARERLASDVTEKVKPECQKMGIIIEPIAVAQIDTTADLDELLTQIADRTRAQLTRKTNLETIAQLKSQQGVLLKRALKLRETEMGNARTELNQEQQKAEGAVMAQEAKLKQDLDNAELGLDAARFDAKAALSRGKVQADLIHKKNEAEVSGLKTAIQGFRSADQYAQYQVMSKLAPALTEIFASDDSDFAKLFAGYMTPPKKESITPITGGGGPP